MPQQPGTDGYVTGIVYPRRYYRELNPASIAFAALQCGYAAPRLDRPFRYLDLGCGHGVSPTLFAALFPRGEFIGIDFNPDHIASAEHLRVTAALDNARFLAGTFSEMIADTTITEADCDFIVLHGVMSWVSKAVQAEITTLIDRRLKPGGLVYVSYNCQPGWAVKMPLRQLLLDAYDCAVGNTVEERLAGAIAVLRHLAESGSHYIDVNPGLRHLLDTIETQEAGYLAHEFLNRNWTVFYHRDMAAQMKAIGLDYLGSANTADNIPLLALPQKPAALIQAMPDPVMKETLRDMALNRQFRRDVYGRVQKSLSLASHITALRETCFALARPREACVLVVQRSFGDLTLDGAIFDPLLDRLTSGPASFTELAAIPPLNGWDIADQSQAIQVLVGADFVRPIVAGAAVASESSAVRRFNHAAIAIAQAAGDKSVVLAVPAWSDAVVQSLGS
jgi:SAM-dependent methyltransferase